MLRGLRVFTKSRCYTGYPLCVLLDRTGIGLFMLFLAMGGCAGGQPVPKSLVSPLLTSSSCRPFDPCVLHAGDKLVIKVFGYPELYQRQEIRPDGNITAQLIGDVRAEGLTPAELDASLTKAYRRMIRRPEVAVIMRSFSDRTVFVGGDVRRPGEIPLGNRLTALQALFSAGGNTDEAKLKSVILVRSHGVAACEIWKLNLSQTGKKGTGDIFLQPFDVLFVPKTKIAKVDRFVEQYVQQILPDAFRVRLRDRVGLNPERNTELIEFLP